MSKRIQTMKALVPYLLKKDQNIALKYIQDRDFGSLKDLVDSSIIIINKHLKDANIKQEYLDANMEILNHLKAEVTTYCMQLGILDDDLDDDLEYDPRVSVDKDFYL